MLRLGSAKKIIIHLNEDTGARNVFLYNEILAFLKNRGVVGATPMRPAAGFGSHRPTHSAEGGPGENVHLPIRIEFIESSEAAGVLLSQLCALITDGLIEAHDTPVIQSAVWETTS